MNKGKQAQTNADIETKLFNIEKVAYIFSYFEFIQAYCQFRPLYRIYIFFSTRE